MADVDYVGAVASIAEARARGEHPLAYTRTYGCQGNVSDSERINGLLALMGYSFTDDINEADFIICNTCAVREHAEDRVFGNVGALKHIKARHPDTIIAVCGCMAQQERVAKRLHDSYPYVSLVFGTHVIHRLPELLYRVLTGGERMFELSQDDSSIHEEIPVMRDGGVRAWLPIMYGCNNFCSYCVVPYVRGRERSRDMAAIIEEFRAIIAAGYRDITLLGQNVNSYGWDLYGESHFPELLRELDKIPGDYWLRFMTSHPKDCSPELLDAMRDCGHAARHLHLPFQSGSSGVLRRMNRGYTRDQYLMLISAARERMPDISITSDVIVGFPGETAEEFNETLSLIKEVGFTSLFTFIFSARDGTPAAAMADPTPREEKQERMSRLLALQEGIAAERCKSMLGTTQRVLAESIREDGRLHCRTSGNVIVDAEGAIDAVGSFCDADITEARNWILRGKIL